MFIRFMLVVGVFFTLVARSIKDSVLPFILVGAIATILGAIIAAVSGGSGLTGALWTSGIAVAAYLSFNVIRVLSVLR